MKRPSLEILEDRTLPSTLSGLAFNDLNHNGTQDSGENSLAGVTVTLTGTDSTNHSVKLQQTTDASGAFSFTGLNAGTYGLSVTSTSGYILGLATPGTDGGSAGLGAVSGISLGSNDSATGYGFGELAKSNGWTATAANFNGTAIPAGSTVWFSSVFKASNLGSGPVTLTFTNQSITFTASGVTQTIAVPDSTITFDPSVTSATTTFDTATNQWVTTLPMHFSGNGFLSGVALPVPGGLPGGIKSATWQGQVLSGTGGVSVNWQWAAAVYTSFSTDYTTVNVKPVDDNHASAIANSDHAGTPETFKTFVIGGATGGGGANYTGSYSATSTVTPAQVLATLSGHVFDDSNNNTGLAGVVLTLTGVNDLGQTVTFTTTTGADGSYSFAGLRPGTYTITQTVPDGYTADATNAGTVNGHTDGTVDSTALTHISAINLTFGNNGINYDFFDGLVAPPK
jgi:hypothetical protein